MKVELVKRQDRWDLYGEDGSKIASSAPNPIGKLSIKNCESIANGYDLDELASERLSTRFNENSGYHKFVFVEAYKEGFLKAIELLGDKKFSEDDMLKAVEYGVQSVLQAIPGLTSAQSVLDSYKQSLQQTEFDVEVLMGTHYRQIDCVNEGELVKSKIVKDNEAPMLDKDGCLILKRL